MTFSLQPRHVVVAFVVATTALIYNANIIDDSLPGPGRMLASALPGLRAEVGATGGPDRIKSATISSSSNSKGRIPNFLLAGAQKAGTTATFEHLSRGNDTCFGNNKEIHFFDRDEQFVRGLDYYQREFAHCAAESPIIIDATPNYMLYPERVRQIYEKHGTADTVKIMFTLREPVRREISWYDHLVRSIKKGEIYNYVQVVLKSNGSVMSFEEHMEANILPSIHAENPTNLGLYEHMLARWFTLFDRNQIFIASYDDLKADPEDFLERLHEFLDLPFTAGALKAPHANSKHVKTKPIPCSVQKLLADVYQEYNEDLYTLLHGNPGLGIEKPFAGFHFHCEDTP